MEKTFIERRVYSGGLVKGGYKISSISIVADKGTKQIRELCQVQNHDSYSHGCPLHAGCFGHISVTPNGNLLPPHSLSMRSGDIRTEYYNASILAFSSSKDEYRALLNHTCYGKYGTLRSTMSTPVAGSARLVVTPHNYSDIAVVFVSENLASKILCCTIQVLEDGAIESTYKERSLEQGDYVMFERPPSLGPYSNQPFRVEFWNNDTLGIHPDVFDAFHGDYDGDETHIYVLTDPESIEEAKNWIHKRNERFNEARAMFNECVRNSSAQLLDDTSVSFIRYTTLSARQLLEGKKKVYIGDQTRNKKAHLTEMTNRLTNPRSTQTFLKDAKKGISDISRQQLTQPVVGYMTRIARLAMMCVVRDQFGDVWIVGRVLNKKMHSGAIKTVGSPACRVAMTLCSAAQQSALDAHRVGSVESKSIDLISSLLKGRQGSVEGKGCSTLYLVSGTGLASVKLSFNAQWAYYQGEFYVVLALDTEANEDNKDTIVGAYSPVVLAACDEDSRLDMCILAVGFVMSIYNLEVEEDDIIDFCCGMIYQVERSVYPFTTPLGMKERDVGAIETLLANDYTLLPRLAGSTCRPITAVSATWCSNYTKLQ